VSAESDRVVRLGEITGVHGLKGWVKVHSFTEPRTNLIDYPVWLLELPEGRATIAVESGRESGKRLIAKLEGVDTPEAAAELAGVGILVPRSSLPPPDPGEYYWADLEGLAVKGADGKVLGRVERLIGTGANDVLVLEGPEQHMIPFVMGQVVERVDLDAGEIIVNWNSDFFE
jgi:16S rRNA processing protein RimM